MRFERNAVIILAMAAAAGSASCGGGGTGTTPPPPPPPPPPGLAIAPASSGSGEGQQGAAGSALANPLRVLLSRGGEPAVGVTVNWSAAGTGAGLAPSNSTSGADGIATTTWTLPHAAGAATASASASGATGSPVAFHATVHAAAAAQIATASGGGQTAPAGTQLTTPFKVIVGDAFGNPVEGTNVTWTVITGGGSIEPTSSTTASDGTTSARMTLGPIAGGNSGRATASGLTGSPVTFVATGTAVPTGTAVAVGNDFFAPAVMQTTAGSTVTWTWTNTGASSHGIQSLGNPSFTSGTILTGNGSTYSVTFNTPGTYQYDCIVHGLAMSGTIIVQ